MHYLVVVAESICNVEEMAKQVQEATGIDTRATILGHVQRGGRPTVRDRVLATRMGFAAVELLKEGIGNRVVAWKGGQIVDYDIYEALNMHKSVNTTDLHIAHRISI